jgi:L-threonylcarbamoyladenylate synthase
MQPSAEHLRAGGLLVFPTETFYALGADPRSETGVAAVFALKRRDPTQPLPLLAGSREQIDQIASGWSADRAAARLASRFWPGPLTLILQPTQALADGVCAPDGSIAVRWSPCVPAQQLALALGAPLVATSANRTGQPPHTSARLAWEALGRDAAVLIFDAGVTPGGAPSTIVDTRAGRLLVVREGAISRAMVTDSYASS